MATDDLREAMATVREYEASAAAQWPIGSLDPKDEQSAFELIARWLVANAGELVRVKGLEWYGDDVVFTIFGAMVVTESELVLRSVVHPGIVKLCGCESLADGKAKAEAHYRARLAAALEPIIPMEAHHADD